MWLLSNQKNYYKSFLPIKLQKNYYKPFLPTKLTCPVEETIKKVFKKKYEKLRKAQQFNILENLQNLKNTLSLTVS